MSLLTDSTATYTFRFPHDIERYIFERAAYRDHEAALLLITVAKRVAQW